MIHFNIGKKVEVNPFENVKFVTIASNKTTGTINLENFLHKNAKEVIARRVNERFILLFDVELLDFTTLLKWLAPYRGVFYLGNHTIHFRIDEDIMYCW